MVSSTVSKSSDTPSDDEPISGVGVVMAFLIAAAFLTAFAFGLVTRFDRGTEHGGAVVTHSWDQGRYTDGPYRQDLRADLRLSDGTVIRNVFTDTPVKAGKHVSYWTRSVGPNCTVYKLQPFAYQVDALPLGLTLISLAAGMFILVVSILGTRRYYINRRRQQRPHNTPETN